MWSDWPKVMYIRHAKERSGGDLTEPYAVHEETSKSSNNEGPATQSQVQKSHHCENRTAIACITVLNEVNSRFNTLDSHLLLKISVFYSIKISTPGRYSIEWILTHVELEDNQAKTLFDNNYTYDVADRRVTGLS